MRRSSRFACADRPILFCAQFTPRVCVRPKKSCGTSTKLLSMTMVTVYFSSACIVRQAFEACSSVRRSPAGRVPTVCSHPPSAFPRFVFPHAIRATGDPMQKFELFVSSWRGLSLSFASRCSARLLATALLALALNACNAGDTAKLRVATETVKRPLRTEARDPLPPRPQIRPAPAAPPTAALEDARP